MWQPRRKNSKAKFRLRRINGLKQQNLFRCLPLGVPKDIYMSVACNFVTQTPRSTFRADSPMTSDRNFWAAIKCISLVHYFPNSASLLLLRKLIETVQSVVTIKCALDRSAYKGITHGHSIKINCLVSVGAEMSNRNIKLWNSYTKIFFYYQQCAIIILSTPVLQQVWPIT